MAKILVTGGAGFIGSHLVKRLLREGHDICVIDNLTTGDKHLLPPSVLFYEADITSPHINEPFKAFGPEVLIHLAAQTQVSVSQENPKADATVNIIGTLNLLNACVKGNVRHVIFASSAAVYGDVQTLPVTEETPASPLSAYGLSKLTAERYIELYAQLYGFVYTTLRFANVYGPKQSASTEAGVVTIFLHQLLNGQSPVIYGDGEQTRDFVYVEDVVQAIIDVLNTPQSGLFHVSSGEEVSVNALLRELCGILELPFNPIYQPERPGDIARSCLSNHKIKQAFHWTPRYSLKEGLQEMIMIEYNQKR
ncbi:UDP-glucose 4-epimerase [Caldalkalibacillus thermarum]|uniref:NAD-dependent epimerase/dehydratase family protein n=1 Tax=Caldalkalibacillus thermarum TaxID=296745 RepID=UPI0016691494|nr:NAD-dependent epimerase/dehydratase family protein [Caldalkalibacillus thermarum]GGK33344.1 UDP-glucose 4-epimerase [Caldalkalibacillus thermarum]